MTFKTEPYAHQLEAFERFKDAAYFALFMDMGTGKTKVTIDIAAYKWEKGDINAILLIAPNNVHTQWVKEQLPLHCSAPYTPFIWSSGLVGRGYYKSQLDKFIALPSPTLKVFAINVEAFQSESVIPYVAKFVKTYKCLIVIDEATRIKNVSAKRTKVIHRLEKYGYRAILTGTPTAKSPFDLWSQMEFLKANYFKCNYFIFQHRYGVMAKAKNYVTGQVYTATISEEDFWKVKRYIKNYKLQKGGILSPVDYEVIGKLHGISLKNIYFIEKQEVYAKYKRLDELKAIIAADTFSVKKADCLDLPPKVYEHIYVDMSKAQKEIYNSLVKDLIAHYKDKELTVLNKISLTMRLMQVVGGFFPFVEPEEHRNANGIYYKYKAAGELIGETNIKLTALLADLEEVDIQETKIIIWCHFVSELKYIYAELKKHYTCCLYYGGTPDLERKQIIEDFKAGKYEIFIGNAATAGFGLNLQNATLQYYFSNSFRTEDRLQAEDRSHRIGVKSTVVYKDIIAKGTVDERVYNNIAVGRDLNDYFKSVTLDDLLTEVHDD